MSEYGDLNTPEECVKACAAISAKLNEVYILRQRVQKTAPQEYLEKLDGERDKLYAARELIKQRKTKLHQEIDYLGLSWERRFVHHARRILSSEAIASIQSAVEADIEKIQERREFPTMTGFALPIASSGGGVRKRK